jgi:hypothetical protein
MNSARESLRDCFSIFASIFSPDRLTQHSKGCFIYGRKTNSYTSSTDSQMGMNEIEASVCKISRAAVERRKKTLMSMYGYMSLSQARRTRTIPLAPLVFIDN